MASTDTSLATSAPSKRLRVWLIIVTFLAVLGLIASVPGMLFGTYMAAFAADDPSASTGAVWNLMVTVWAVGLGFIVLLMAGVIGGWIAYRKRRGRLAFGLSLLAAVPILLILVVVTVVVLTSFIWTAMIP